MNGKRLFKKHYHRLVLEGLIKAGLVGLAIGFGANFLAAAFAWLFDFGGIWFAIGVGIGVAVISTVLLYFLKFKPTEREVAARVDRLGLEERMITMLELEREDSYIANLQRENAREHLKSVENRRIRIRIGRLVVAMTVAAAVLGSTMTTVVGLAENDIIPPGPEVILPDDPLLNYIPVTYLVEGDEGGEIEGETDQLVAPGEDATPVVAVAEDGWMFIGWDDGLETTERIDRNITEERVIFAIFEEIIDGDGEDGEDAEGGPQGGEEGDKADDLPAGGEAAADSEQNGDAGDKGDGSGSDGDSDGGQGSTEDEGEGKGDGQGVGAGGKWEDSNQFIDGKTYYRDYLDMYYQMALEIFEQNGEIPPELREFFETYYNSI